MKSYVLGFAFDDLGRVALIQKERPDWQRGLWNGVGGHIEPGEPSVEAMEREFREETGAHVPAREWSDIGTMIGPDWFVHVYTVTSSAVRFAATVTDETVALFVPWRLPGKAILNVPAMIRLAQIPIAHRPTFVLSYHGH